MDSDTEARVGGGCFVFVVLAIAVWFLWAVPAEYDRIPVRGTIEDAYVKRQDDSDRFFIALRHDDQLEVLTNRDVLLQGKFNSADVQQQLRKIRESGVEACLIINGRRVPFFSWFRNVVEARAC